MKKNLVLPIAIFLVLGSCQAGALASKFSSSFGSEYTTQTTQQDIPSAPIITPAPVSTTPVSAPPVISTQAIPQETSSADASWNAPVAPSREITAPESPLPAAITTPAAAPMTALPAAAALSTINTGPSLSKTKITVPDYEEKYKKLLMAQEETKRHKKKSLIDSILDEIVHYGFLIALAVVIFIVWRALRKDKETPGTGLHLPQHPASKIPQEPKKNIWDDEF